MRTGTCPKCGASKILKAPTGTWPGLHQIHIGPLDSAVVQCLICARCGLVETYVHSEHDLKKMIRAFPLQSPSSEASRRDGAGDGPSDGR